MKSCVGIDALYLHCKNWRIDADWHLDWRLGCGGTVGRNSGKLIQKPVVLAVELVVVVVVVVVMVVVVMAGGCSSAAGSRQAGRDRICRRSNNTERIS